MEKRKESLHSAARDPISRDVCPAVNSVAGVETRSADGSRTRVAVSNGEDADSSRARVRGGTSIACYTVCSLRGRRGEGERRGRGKDGDVCQRCMRVMDRAAESLDFFFLDDVTRRQKPATIERERGMEFKANVSSSFSSSSSSSRCSTVLARLITNGTTRHARDIRRVWKAAAGGGGSAVFACLEKGRKRTENEARGTSPTDLMRLYVPSERSGQCRRASS